jgi:hypothetical protein
MRLYREFDFRYVMGGLLAIPVAVLMLVGGQPGTQQTTTVLQEGPGRHDVVSFANSDGTISHYAYDIPGSSVGHVQNNVDAHFAGTSDISYGVQASNVATTKP